MWELETIRTTQIAPAKNSVTNLKCLSDFCHFFFYFDDKSRDKQEINGHERVRNNVFLQHNYYVTDDVIYKHMNYQLSTRKSPYALVFRSPRGNLLKTRLENIAKNKAPL